MAKNNALIPFTGKLGNIVGYKRNGKFVLQQKGGFDGERIKTETRYETTRQLNSEFGRCSSIASLLKKSLQKYLDYIPDVYIYNWIQSGMLDIKSFDTESTKGTKTVMKGLQTDSGFKYLNQLQFNRNKKLNSILSVKLDIDLLNGSLTFNPNELTKGLHYPKGITIACMELVMMRFDFDQVVCHVNTSDTLIIQKDAIPNEAIKMAASVPEGDGVLIGLLFVGFCQKSGKDIFWLRRNETVLGVVGSRL